MSQEGMDEKVLSQMNAPALREYIRSLLAKRGKPRSDKESKEADKEREDLADLHEETKGKTAGVPVTDEDMSFDLGGDEESDGDEEDSQASEPPAPPKKKKDK